MIGDLCVFFADVARQQTGPEEEFTMKDLCMFAGLLVAAAAVVAVIKLWQIAAALTVIAEKLS